MQTFVVMVNVAAPQPVLRHIGGGTMHTHIGSRLALTLTAAFLLVLLASFGVALAETDSATDEPTSPPTVVGVLTDKQTATSTTYLLSNGMKRLEVYGQPIRFKDESGAWQEFDTSLIATDTSGYYRSAQTPATVTLGPGSLSLPVQLTADGYTIALGLEGGNGAQGAILGDTASYAAVATDTSASYRVLRSGVEQSLILASAEAPASFTCRLSHPGLTLARDDSGEWGFYAPGDPKPVFVLSGITVFDASKDAAGMPAFCGAATMSVSPGKGGSTLTYAVPKTWLSDQARVYPVTIDPTLTVNPNTGNGGYPDTCVSQANPTSSYGTGTSIGSGKDASGVWRALFRFGLSGLPADAYVHAATFAAYKYANGGSNAASYVHPMNKNWSGSSSWNDLGCVVGSFPSSFCDASIGTQTVVAPGWLSIGCPQTVQSWADGGKANYGFLVRQNEGLGASFYSQFRAVDSSDTEHWPRLTIDYDSPPVAVTTDRSLYAIGDTVTVTSKVASYYPGEVRMIQVGLNRASGDPDRYRGVMGWFKSASDKPAGWTQSSAQPNGSIFAYDPTATYGNDKITVDFGGCSQATCGGSPGYKRATFQFEIEENFGSLAAVTPDTTYALGPGSTITWTKGWATPSGGAFTVLAGSVDTTTYTTTASDWWQAASGNCDDNDHGRGSLTLMWPSVAGAAGYHIYLADGSLDAGQPTNPVYRQVGATIRNGDVMWSSADAGFYPSDTDIGAANWPGGEGGDPFYRAATPADATEQDMLEPSGVAGAGLCLSDGSYLYVRRWNTHAGPYYWTKIGSGYGGTTAGQVIGTVGPSLSGKNAYSAFFLGGYLYNGYVTKLAGSKATIQGVKTTDGTIGELELSSPPLNRATGAPISSAGLSNVYLTCDGSQIYSFAYTLTTDGGGAPRYDGYKLREYDSTGHFVCDRIVAMPSQIINGVVCDGSFVEAIQWTGGSSAHVTRISASSWSLVNQWHITQGLYGVVSGCYDSVNNVYWLGAIDQGKIYRYAGSLGGLELRDNPGPLYEANGGAGGPFASWTAYDVKVVPVDEAGAEMAVEPSGKVAATLDKRTLEAHIDPKHTSSELDSWAGHDTEVRLDLGSLRSETSDLAVASWGPEAAVRRTYDSSNSAAGLFAPGWRFGFEQGLAIGQDTVIYTDPSGDGHSFALVGDSWLTPEGFFGTLTQESASLWILALDDKTKLWFDGDGKLICENDRNGNATAYGYASGKLTTITAANGQEIELSYSDAKLTSVSYTVTIDNQPTTRQVNYQSAAPWQVTYYPEEPEERTVAYGYDGQSRLSEIKQLDWPQSGKSALETFTYEDGALTEVDFADYWSTTEATPRTVAKADARATIAYGGASAAITRYGTIATAEAPNGAPNTPVTTELDVWDPQTKQLAEQTLARNGSENTTTSFDYAANLACAHSICTATDTDNTTAQTVSATDESGNLVAESDDGVGMTTYTYTDAENPNLPTTETDSTGTTENSYDDNGNLESSEKTLNGAGEISRTECTYDGYGRMTREKQLISGEPGADPVWTTTDYSVFAANGEPQTSIARDVRFSDGGATHDLTTITVYDEFGDLRSKTDSSGTRVTETDSYDLAGRQVSQTDAVGAVTHHSYDKLSYETATWTTHQSRLDTGNPPQPIKFNWTASTFDALGRALEETTSIYRPAENDYVTQRTATSTYDGLGNILTSDDSTVGGQAAKWVYDVRGNVIKCWNEGVVEYTDARATQTIYDAENNELASTNPGNSNPTTSIYDAAGNLIEKTNPDGSWVAYTYDDTGNKTSETKPKAGYAGDHSKVAVTEYTYDWGGRMTSEEKPSGLTTTFAYDELGRQVSASGGGGPASTTTYNTLGWVLETDDADGVSVSNVYDSAGRLESETKGTQQPTSLTYDDCSRLLTETDPAGSVTAYTYDCFGNTVKEKHTVGAAVVKEIDTTLDSLGRPISSSDAVSGTTHTWTYPVNTAAGVSEVETYGWSGAATTISRSARGFETERSTDIGTGTPLLRTVDGRDAAERVTQATLASAPAAHWSYDGAGRLVRQWGAGWTAGAANSDAYSYDPDTGRKTTDNLQLALGGTITGSYSYTAAGRLHVATIGGVAATHSFDTAGNLTEVIEGATTTTFTYGAGSRLTQIAKTGADTVSVSWDQANGRRDYQGPASDPDQIDYTFSAAGYLASYTNAATGKNASYTYDAQGQRRSAIVNGTIRSFLYDGLTLLEVAKGGRYSWKISYLYDEQGTPYGGVYRTGAGAPVPFAIVTSDRGDAVELTDAAGDAFVSYRYDAWGNPLSDPVVSETDLITLSLATDIAARQVLRYAGYVYDSESGLYYCSARYYDPATRQWISKDPEKADGEESAYQYCGGDPVGSSDITGEHSVAVPNIHQHVRMWKGGPIARNWCWAACCRSVIQYLTGRTPSLRAIVRFTKGKVVDEGGNAYEKMWALKHWGVKAALSPAAEWSELHTWFANDKPVIATIFWTAGGVHDVVLCGAYKNLLFKSVKWMDPHYPKKVSGRYSYFRSNSSWRWRVTLKCSRR